MYGSAPHYAHSGNTVDRKKLKKSFVIPKPVHVHVPQAGDQKLPGRIHNLRVFRCAHACAWTNFCNAITCNHYSHVGFGGCSSGVDDCDVSEDERLELTAQGLNAQRLEIENKSSKHEQW